ncbi:MAG: glycosyltransferase [Burkholderiales bacterium]|nr:glycosyltransferase [Burkholderiales bacterium]
MIAYHFPPLSGSSGIQRTLRFVQQLPSHGWEPLVLTAHPRAYVQTSDDLLAEVPAGLVVRRAFALDSARHLALFGRYAAFTARPDRWVSWRYDGVRQGVRMVREFAPAMIWSTYPFATAHLIGAEVARRSGLPWIADFRDPMAQPGYPADPVIHRQFLAIEATAAAQARACTFTTPGAVRTYRERYPRSADRMLLLENGFDEGSFAQAALRAERAGRKGGPLIVLHSGILYPQERDPTHLFSALRRLHATGRLTPAQVRLRFRASAHDDHIRRLAAEQGVGEFVELAPSLPYLDALAEMLSVDALLIMQDAGCNDQIPAKAYEYLRAGRPILAITDPAGDTADLVRRAGIDAIAKLESADAIESTLMNFVRQLAEGRAGVPAVDVVTGMSREARSREFAALLDCL